MQRLEIKGARNMTRSEVAAHLAQVGGRIFSVEFIKRTDGILRRMVCRRGVTSHLKGGEQAYDAAEHRLLTVFDMSKNAYRSIPYEGITKIKIAGLWEDVE
jgi:hypothetical protein